MTTTLRPAGPLLSSPDGVRSRRYLVLVNGRPVGRLELGTHPAGPGAGRVRSLWIDEQDRGRGRGTVAALAAEEVLRGWGCRQALASAPADADAAWRLLLALGYTEYGRSTAKEIAARPPALPPGVTARPATDAESASWRERCRADLVRDGLSQGPTGEQAQACPAGGHGQAPPEVTASPGDAVRVLLHEGRPVGGVWLVRRDDEAEGPGVIVLGVRVDPGRRGEGFGRALMLEAERVAFDRGADRLGLYVPADDTTTAGLGDALGYTPAERHFLKQLL